VDNEKIHACSDRMLKGNYARIHSRPDLGNVTGIGQLEPVEGPRGIFVGGAPGAVVAVGNEVVQRGHTGLMGLRIQSGNFQNANYRLGL
jgi:hypothetical protein